MADSKEFFLPFVKKEQVAKHTYSFYFSAKGGPAFGWDFLPGQYIRMVLPHERADTRGTSRFFTVASSPTEKNYLMITTRVIRSTFKKRLASLVSGEKVRFFGPMGNLVLRDQEKESLVLMAGGMGITPFRSVIKYAGDKNLHVKLTLLVSFSATEEMIFYDELTKIASEHSNIKVVYLSSGRSPAGHLPGGAKYYVAGSPEMVEATKQLLESLRTPEEKVLTESFIDY